LFFLDVNKVISVNSFGGVNVVEKDENSFSELLKQQNAAGSTLCRKANSEVQQRLKDLQKPTASSIRRSFSDGVMQQPDYSPSDLQALNDSYADQAKLELDAKFNQLVNSQNRSGK